jgi:arabinofuranosyltransferase
MDQTPGTKRLVVLAAALAVALILVRTAWVGDDAYITFRTVDNALHGHGLRWNVDNRVQAFTHPLWMFAMLGATAVTGDVYYTSIVLSIALTLAALVLLLGRLTPSVAATILVTSVLLLSKAFIDYSTSGLENPLTHFLLVVFFVVAATATDGQRRLFWLSLLTSLIMLNRFDAGLLVLPVLLVGVWKNGVAASLRPVALGIIPLVVWEVFSLVYYGFPFPNTAYAKLDTGIPRSELVHQGFLYLLDLSGNDPVTLVVVLLAVGLPLVLHRSWTIAAGVALYLVYVVMIGGDFMSGRLLAEPLLCSVIDLAAVPLIPFSGAWMLGLGLVWLVGLSAPRPSILTNGSFGSDTTPAQLLRPNGVQEERRYYYPAAGLLTAHRDAAMPNHRWFHLGEELRRSGMKVSSTDGAGYLGYAAGPNVHLIDSWALGDPLLARLPAEVPWRVGHFKRRAPEGYRETIETGRDLIRDPDIAAYYEKVRVVTQSPIWSMERFRAILDMNLWLFERFVKSYELIRVSSADVAAPVPDGTPWDHALDMTLRGIEIKLPGPTRGAQVELSLSRNDTYRVIFFSKGVEAGESTIQQVLMTNGSLRTHVIPVPMGTSAEFDAVRVLPSGGDSLYSLGHLLVR